jgi:hypothetical protein
MILRLFPRRIGKSHLTTTRPGSVSCAKGAQSFLCWLKWPRRFDYGVVVLWALTEKQEVYLMGLLAPCQVRYFLGALTCSAKCGLWNGGAGSDQGLFGCLSPVSAAALSSQLVLGGGTTPPPGRLLTQWSHTPHSSLTLTGPSRRCCRCHRTSSAGTGRSWRCATRPTPRRTSGTRRSPCPGVLCCAVLCCAVLCCAVLCCAVLCCAVLCCAVLCCAVLCCEV